MRLRDSADRRRKPVQATSDRAGAVGPTRDPAAVPANHSGHLGTHYLRYQVSVLGLQRRVWNSAVVALLKSISRRGSSPTPPQSRLTPMQQRAAASFLRGAGLRAQRATAPVRAAAPLPVADDPSGYTQPKGVANVANSGTTRIEVHGLKYGVVGGFQKGYKGRTIRPSAEAGMTKESPETGRRHHAGHVGRCPIGAGDPAFPRLGIPRWRTDPYAGYTVATGGPGPKHGKLGTVRDVDQGNTGNSSIGAVNAGRARDAENPGPQTVAILAQGRGMSDFGNIPTFDYVGGRAVASSATQGNQSVLHRAVRAQRRRRGRRSPRWSTG